ncbi:MAG TPA: hypothetical protein VMP11_03955 [Verrucomicrobiae bacterium]|nr:hypothetical protein [Verrucomicrobiae bacterium]
MTIPQTRTTPRAILFLGAGASQFAGYCTFQSFDTLFLDPNVRQAEKLPPVQDTTLELMRELRSSLENQRPPRPVTHDNYLWLLNKYREFCDTYYKGDSVSTRVGNRADHLGSIIDRFQHHIDTTIGDITNTTIHHYSMNRATLLKSRDANGLQMLLLILA